MKVFFIVAVLALVAYTPSAGTKVKTTAKPVPKAFLTCNRWTPFYSRDDPGGIGDYETLLSLRSENDNICASPVSLEYETVSKKSCINTGEVITASPTYGFSCVNSQQPGDQKCNDYKVRFCCLDAKVKCPDGYDWTKFYNRDDPGKTGDWELLGTLRKENPNKICEQPIAIDVRRKSKGDDYRKSDDNVTFSPSYGFVCKNEDQKDKLCEDYKVRFCCPWKK